MKLNPGVLFFHFFHFFFLTAGEVMGFVSLGSEVGGIITWGKFSNLCDETTWTASCSNIEDKYW